MRNLSHRLEYLNTWSPIGGSIWEGLGGLSGGSFRWVELHISHHSQFCLFSAGGWACEFPASYSAHLLPPCLLNKMGSYTSETVRKNLPFLSIKFCSGCFIIVTEELIICNQSSGYKDFLLHTLWLILMSLYHIPYSNFNSSSILLSSTPKLCKLTTVTVPSLSRTISPIVPNW